MKKYIIAFLQAFGIITVGSILGLIFIIAVVCFIMSHPILFLLSIFSIGVVLLGLTIAKS